ncbi:MAG: DUF3306 domain-containing protein [Rhodospirillaceae bacterium]|nr:DUF3306 domain-containing protein [Rhodospirillales bacterium]
MTDNFLSRWSRLKAEAKEETPPPAPVEAEQPPGELAPPELPPVETLTKDSDFSAFLQAGVPEAIKRAAMAKLWSSDPLFSQPEVFDLHMEDYSFPTIPDVVKTAWKVGKGIVEELAPVDQTASFPDAREKTHTNADEDDTGTRES